MNDLTPLHEAAHAVAARQLGIDVVRVVAAGDDPHCRTRWRTPRTAEEEIDVLSRLALVDLVGVAIEDETGAGGADRIAGEAHCITDCRNAWARLCRIIALEDGIAYEQVRPEHVLPLWNWTMKMARRAVAEDAVPIARLAHRLEEAGEVSGAVVDAVLLEADET